MPFLQPTSIFSILIALSVHEWAHAFVADKLGDPTPRQAGRLTLNPVAHLDPLGAILFLAVGFGWAKPVPINGSHFRHEKRDTALVAIAGPVSNLILAAMAFAGLILLSLVPSVSTYDILTMAVDGDAGSPLHTLLVQICASSLFINLALMAFNLIPIVPLDGSRVLLALLPARLEWRFRELMQYGPTVLLALLLAEAIFGFPVLSLWVHTIVEWVMRGFFLFV